MLSSPEGFADFLNLYYRTMCQRPEFPKLILKVLALKQGPGRRFIHQLLERGRARGARKVAELQAAGQAAASLDPDMVRLVFVSLAMTPMLLKEVFEEQMARPLDARFFDDLARFNGRLIAAGLAPA
ncbi:hypothetical protein [Methylogaea oryzae]|uniref:hypothetical protein n=1 Tax=Methylogaea oryzae TaxID=1295382 RepID=UPI0020D0C16A|nr:hypothetical protein [Methylogaea oryzae]